MSEVVENIALTPTEATILWSVLVSGANDRMRAADIIGGAIGEDMRKEAAEAKEIAQRIMQARRVILEPK